MTGRSKGYAFIEYAHTDEAEKAYQVRRNKLSIFSFISSTCLICVYVCRGVIGCTLMGLR